MAKDQLCLKNRNMQNGDLGLPSANPIGKKGRWDMSVFLISILNNPSTLPVFVCFIALFEAGSCDGELTVKPMLALDLRFSHLPLPRAVMAGLYRNTWKLRV